MNKKKCLFCSGLNCIKKGIQQGHQRWQCKDCKKKFQANKKVPPSKEELFCLYVFSKQTLSELNQSFHIKEDKIQIIFDLIIIPERNTSPEE